MRKVKQSNPADVDKASIAVVGMSGRFPGAKNVDAFWENLAAGVESTRDLSDAELAAAQIDQALLQQTGYVRRCSSLENVELFDADFFDLTAREAAIAAPSQRMLLMCAHEALEDACCVPKDYKGSIGVFVGANRCDEWQKRLYELSDQFSGQLAKQLQFLIASDLDYTSTRISYKLNLTGPSMSISTACSTSLVAIIQACRSLLSRECDLALAGGSNVLVPQEVGYLYEEGGIKSSDGRCRAFDAQADGTIFGNGAGVIVLKRLEEALADRDNIHAIIRGSAINNDGSAKVGYTAPSVTGQSRVISAALAAADVHPEHIAYVETHGTGTSLGDPIEIEALSQAYRSKTRKKQYCAVGSVKTNIGHLGSAAGVAGFIKAIQALKHKKIPPSLHFTQPNPEIDFASSPFFVNTELKPWPANGAPRRAAISSFGVGGTNAHVILEEAPLKPASSSSRKHQLFVLSAKSPAALSAMSQNLADTLAQKPELDLADVASSLSTGRETYQYRRACVADRVDAALEALRDDAVQIGNVKDGEGPPEIAFMFPGQGAQHVQMGLGLYEQEEVFRDAVDECAQLLKPSLNLDLRDLLFPCESEGAAAELALKQTAIAQPALFVVEYALAQLWQSWGIRPAKMIGHSIGEYVAACLSGVFSLEDALRLVAERGRLMQSMPGGAMLAVSMPEAELSPLLQGCDLAAVNGPSWCVAAGPEAAIQQLERQLSDREVFCRRLHTSHAFHSAMMDPILKEYWQAVSKIRLHPPKIPFISNLAGDWIKNHQATDPEYWVRQLRGSVQFYAGGDRLLKDKRTVMLEVGPGQTLITLVKAFQPQNGTCTILPSCRQVNQPQHDHAFLLQALGQVWMAGGSVDWQGFYGEEQRCRVSLPTYPFQMRRFWLDRRAERPSLAAHQLQAAQLSADMAAGEATQATPASQGRELLAKLQSCQATEREEALRPFVHRCVSTLLGTTDISGDTPLIELGMTSLTAIELRTQLNGALNADSISVVALLDENATINNLASYLSGKLAELSNAVPEQAASESAANSSAFAETVHAATEGGDAASSDFPSSTITIRPDSENTYRPFPLTDIQQAYWIGRHGTDEGGGVATYGYIETDIHDLDVARYEEALNELVRRHHMLRMVVGDDGTQCFLRDVPFYRIPFEDLSHDSAEDRQRKLDCLREAMSHQVLDPATWPLFQIRINKIEQGVHRIHFGFDFLIVDVLSLLVFFRDLFLIYQGETNRLPPLEINFRDYVLVEKASKDSEPYKKAKRYWLDRLATLPPAPMLPYTQEASRIQAPRYARREFTLDNETWGRLKESAKRYRITPSVLIANAFSEVLAQWSKSPKLTINLTIFNRPRLHPQMNDLIGDFTSSVLLEVDMSERASFAKSAKKLQTQLLTDLEHRQFTGVEMLRAMNSQLGGYQAVVMPIVLTSALGLDQYAESRLVGLSEEQLRTYNEMLNLGYAVSQTSQVWLDHVVREKDGMLLCNWDALEELFPAGVLDEMFCAYYDRLIQLANEGDGTWQAAHVARLPAAQEAQRQRVNGSEAPISDEPLQELFEKTAKAKPENIAVVNAGIALTYHDLRVLSSQLGGRLRAQGVKPNQLVAVVMHKGWEQIAAVFGILYGGAAYMPVDAALPKDRIRQLLIQGEVAYALTQAHVIDEVDWPEGVQPIVIEPEQLEQNRQAGLPPIDLSPVQASTDLAYVLFTSGSTGVPKGVMIDHQSAVNTVLDINRRFQVTERDRVLAINALNFDLSVYDVFGLLAAGGTLVMPDYTRALDPAHWADLVVQQGVTLWNTVPAIVQLYIEALEGSHGASPQEGNGLRLVFMSGDWIPVTLPHRIRRAIPSAQPISLGGPTETTVWSICYPIGEVGPDWKSIPYGKPLENRSHQILHSDLTSCPDWVPGEIYTGGRIGLSNGYWRDEEKTNTVFIRHPDTGERLYRTGDWGRFLPSGDIEFLGREDKQVKVQGHRIELGEVEFALRQCDGVQDAVVMAIRDEHSSPVSASVRLVGYVVDDDYSEQNQNAVKSLKSGDVLSDPFEIAAFKLKQVGLRRFDDAERIALPNMAERQRNLVLRSVSDRLPSGHALCSFLTGSPVTLEQFGDWLSCLGQVRLEGHSLPKYYYPSGGSTYAVQTYVYLKPNAVQSVATGLYYYDAVNHGLVRVLAGDEGAPARRLLPKALKDAQFALLFVSNNQAIQPLYGKGAVERFYALEAGHIHNLLAAAGAAHDIGLASCEGIDGEAVIEILGLDADHDFIHGLVGGAVAEWAARAGSQESAISLDCVARQSYRKFAQRPVARQRLDEVLACWSSQHAETADDSLGIYLYAKPGRVDGLPGGFYRYRRGDGKLIELGLVESPIENIQYTRNRKIHRRSAFSLIFVGKKPSGNRTPGDLTQLLTAGYLAQAVITPATRSGLGFCSIGGIRRDAVRPHLPIDDNEDVLYCLEGGPIDIEQTRTWVTDSMQDDTEQAWKETLGAKLPYYMVPGAFVRLKSFPLTANGKVDRKALAAMAQVASGGKNRTLVAPRDAVESTILAVWKDVLKVEQPSIEDNLFELGGDSLAATKLISEAGKALGVHIPLHRLFANPTVAGMAEACRPLLAQGDTAGRAGPTSAQKTSSAEGVKAAELLLDFGSMSSVLEAEAVLDPAIVPESFSPPEVQNPQCVLLTGASGFLGAYVLKELLEKTTADIYCLVRAGKSSSPEVRVTENLTRYGLWRDEYLDRIVAVDGDLSKDRFGLDETTYSYLCRNVDVIYHVGAQVNYARSYQDLKKANVGGAESIIRLACKNKLKAVNFVSSKYVCFGLDNDGIKIYREEAPIPDASGMFIGYTQTKWVAEKLFELAQQRGVPVAFCRPGQISGAAEGDLVLPNDAFHQLVALFIAMRSRPDGRDWADGIIDVLPVDFVARAIVEIGSKQASFGKYYNLINPDSMSMDEFFGVLGRLPYDDPGKMASKPFKQWADDCLAYVHNMEDAAVGYVLEKFFVETEHGHFIKGLFKNGECSTKNVSEALQGTGIHCPGVDESLCRRYFIELMQEGAGREEGEVKAE